MCTQCILTPLEADYESREEVTSQLKIGLSNKYKQWLSNVQLRGNMYSQDVTLVAQAHLNLQNESDRQRLSLLIALLPSLQTILKKWTMDAKTAVSWDNHQKSLPSYMHLAHESSLSTR